MVEEKNLDSAIADKIGQYVKRSGGQDLIDELLASELGQKSKSANRKPRNETRKSKIRFRFFFVTHVRSPANSTR